MCRSLSNACKAIFDCAMEDKDTALVYGILARMEAYVNLHPDELKVCLKVEEYKYTYAKALATKVECWQRLSGRMRFMQR